MSSPSHHTAQLRFSFTVTENNSRDATLGAI